MTATEENGNSQELVLRSAADVSPIGGTSKLFQFLPDLLEHHPPVPGVALAKQTHSGVPRGGAAGQTPTPF